MAKQDNKKLIATAGLAVAGYHAISMYMPTLPNIPLLDNTLVIAIGGGIALWTIWVIWTDY